MAMAAQCRLLTLLLTIAIAHFANGACQSCLMDLTLSSMFGRRASSIPTPKGTSANMKEPRAKKAAKVSRSPLFCNSMAHGLLGAHGMVERRGLWARAAEIGSKSANGPPALGGVFGYIVARQLLAKASGANENNSDESGAVPGIQQDNEQADGKGETSDSEEEKIVSASMVMAIGFYKNWISPLLPPACRFLPTCSQYGVQAIETFGPAKGVLLTAWRLARCSPLGGKGYDPPVWPPVPYTYSSY